MSLFGINPRKSRTRTDPAYNPDLDPTQVASIRPRQYQDKFSLSSQPEPPPQPLVDETALPSSGRIAESSNQPASSLGDLDALSSVVRRTRPREVTPPQIESEYLNRDLQQAQQPAADRNGRVKSAILNALYELGEGAKQELAYGRPVDEYGIARIAGRGIGGAGGGALVPAIDEEYKRHARMEDLENQIATQLQIERRAAETAKTNAEADYLQNVKPGLEAGKQKPKPFVIAGKRINYRRPEGWQGDPNDWEPYEEEIDGKKLVDASKVPDAQGILPSQKLRATLTREQISSREKIADANNRFKSAEAQKDRDFRADENEKDRNVRRAYLSEQVAARLSRDKQSAIRADQNLKRITISLANAKIEAEKWGVSIDEYIDALSDNGVEVIEK